MVGSQTGSQTLIRMTGREIADDLQARIRRGQYPPGAPLPFADLMQLYSTSRSTIQRAMILLEERRLVEYQPGRGRFVAVTSPRSGPAPPERG